MQEDIEEERGNPCPLWGSAVGYLPLTTIKHTGPQPLAYKPQDARISDPMGQHTQQPLVINRVKRTFDTLPTVTSTAIPSGCGLSGPAIRWRAKPWRCWAGAIGKASCICCWYCPMAVAHGYPLPGLI